MTVLGILGGGQLGLMIGREAQRLGITVAILDPDPECSARRGSDRFVLGSWKDAAKAAELAKLCDVVTVETEHIGRDALEAANAVAPLYPKPKVVATIHDRLEQKRFLAQHQIPQPDFRPVSNAQELHQAVKDLGLPVVLKARSGGYDGKGQARIFKPEEAEAAWADIGHAPCIAESFVRFDKEISVVMARGRVGQVAVYPVAENVHRGGILHTTAVPASVSDAVAERATQLAIRIAEALDHVGVMAVEMFVKGEEIWVNELAPRVHNSGHFTLGACITSQFEQHARAVLGLSLGDTSQLRPAVMLNLLGDLWSKGEPDWNRVHAIPGAKLHLYGKAPRPGRKVGHVTLLGDAVPDLLKAAEDLHKALGGFKA